MKALTFLPALLALFLTPVLMFAQDEATPDTGADTEEELDGENGKEEEEDKDPGPFSTDATAAKILALHIRARGGLANIKAIQTVRVQGILKQGKNSYNMTWLHKAPNKFREERHNRHLGRDYIVVRAYDGANAWTQTTSPEKGLPEVINLKKNKSILLENDIFGPLVDWQAKGHNFAYDSQVDLGGTTAYVLKARHSDGSKAWYYFHSEYFSLLKTVFEDSFAGRKLDAEIVPTKRKQIQGVWFDEEVQYQVSGRVYKKITYDRIVLNVSVDDSVFTMPVIEENWIRGTRR